MAAVDRRGGTVGGDAIRTEGLPRSFGTIRAVDGVDLAAPAGTVLGLLGPNGAGKTTIVRILTTLLVPDGGSAQVAGYDVVRDADALRSVIGLAGRPQVLFLDEPTTGLDPRSRFSLWDVIRELVSDGTTLLLTTQYLEEADRLADHIAVIDGGRVIAEGTTDELKSRVGGDLLALRVTDRDRAAEASGAIADLGSGAPQVVAEAREVSLPVREGASLLAEVVRRLDAAGLEISDLALRRPTLDDVFLALTGHVAEAEPDQDDTGTPPRGRGRRPARSNA